MFKGETFMMEIDGVRAALSYGHPWDHSDWLSDRYLQAVDIATAPRLTDEGRAAVGRRLHDLTENHGYVMAVLADYINPTVIPAYQATLAQVADLVSSGVK